MESSCNGCHSQIDPYGLALENYDAVGRYRTVDENALNKPIDPSGQLTPATRPRSLRTCGV